MKFKELKWQASVEIAASALQALIIIALQAAISGIFIVNVDINSNDPTQGSGRSITVYLILFIISLVYQFALVLNAIWEENTIQLIVHVGFNACLFAYNILQLTQLREALRVIDRLDVYDIIFPMLIASVVILGLFTILFAWLTHKLFLLFGWQIYEKLGTKPEIHRMNRIYQIFLMLLKLEYYFFEIFAIQFLVLVLKPQDPEFALTIVAIIVALPIAIFAMYSIKWENWYMVTVWVLILVLLVAYFLFKIIRMYDPSQSFKYVGSINFLTFFGSLALVVTLANIVITVMCVRNFGKGLKEQLAKARTSGASETNTIEMTATADGKAAVDLS